MLVTGGPKTLDFGTVSAFTTISRNFMVVNDLRSSVLVEVKAADERELELSSPMSQVPIPAHYPCPHGENTHTLPTQFTLDSHTFSHPYSHSGERPARWWSCRRPLRR